jgi:hypothetical protein
MQVGEGISIPVYTDGILVECSILAERDAACLMTGAYTEGVNRMNKKAEAELDKILGEDPALKEIGAALKEKVDTVNANTEGLIRRESTEAATTEQAAPVTEPVSNTADASAPLAETPVPVLDPPAPAEMELSEDAMQALAERVATSVAASFTDQLAAADVKHEQAITGLTAQLTQAIARIAKLETPMAEAVKQAIADMPRKSTTVTYRPTQRQQAEQPESAEEVSSEDIAQATLANLR